jgi:hypothetical protein
MFTVGTFKMRLVHEDSTLMNGLTPLSGEWVIVEGVSFLEKLKFDSHSPTMG